MRKPPEEYILDTREKHVDEFPPESELSDSVEPFLVTEWAIDTVYYDKTPSDVMSV